MGLATASAVKGPRRADRHEPNIDEPNCAPFGRHLRRGRRCLDPIGSDIWAMIEQPMSFNALCAALEARYRVDHATCARDVGDLLRELSAEGLVTLDPAPPPAPDA